MDPSNALGLHRLISGMYPIAAGISGRGGNLAGILIIVVTAVTFWIIGIQMRRRIKRDLGRKATEEDLSSIDTWMKVDEVEEQERRDNPLDPR